LPSHLDSYSSCSGDLFSKKIRSLQQVQNYTQTMSNPSQSMMAKSENVETIPLKPSKELIKGVWNLQMNHQFILLQRRIKRLALMDL
jgi:hypothetical protein